MLNQEITTISGPKLVFFAKRPSMSLQCYGKLFLRDNLLTIMLGGIGFLYIRSCFKTMMEGRRNKKLASELFGQVKEQLTKNGNGANGFSREQIKDLFCSGIGQG